MSYLTARDAHDDHGHNHLVWIIRGWENATLVMRPLPLLTRGEDASLN